MQKIFHSRGDCRLCGSHDLDLAVPLAPMPIATPNFVLPGTDKDALEFRAPVPLDLHLCKSCGLLQVLTVGNRDLQYGHYVYTTSVSLGLTEHFRRYADEVVASLAPKAGGLVVELGSNDGTLLGFFKAKGFAVQGVDPAVDIAGRASEAGIPTIPDFFGRAVAARVAAERGKAEIIVANNMIANVDDLSDLVDGVRDLLADDGAFVFETQYGLDVVTNNLLDTVYHEHLSYFFIRPLCLYLRAHGMEVFDVVHVPTKGGSIRVMAKKTESARPIQPSVQAFLDRETEIGAYDRPLYDSLAGRIADVREQLHALADAAHAEGRLVAGYGVSVGTVTLLAQFGMTDKIDILFDDDPAKPRELYGPGYDIPVMGPESVLNQNPGLIVIFAWRYAEPIMAKHRQWLEQGGKAVVPLPDVSIIGA
jgi:hypothetical protein